MRKALDETTTVQKLLKVLHEMEQQPTGFTVEDFWETLKPDLEEFEYTEQKVRQDIDDLLMTELIILRNLHLSGKTTYYGKNW